jgi:hypothetical protein
VFLSDTRVPPGQSDTLKEQQRTTREPPCTDEEYRLAQAEALRLVKLLVSSDGLRLTELVENGLARDPAKAGRAQVSNSRGWALIVAMAELAARAVDDGYSHDQQLRRAVSRALEKVPVTPAQFIGGMPLAMSRAREMIERNLGTDRLTACLFNATTEIRTPGSRPVPIRNWQIDDDDAIAVVRFGPYDEPVTFDHYAIFEGDNR